MAVLEVRDLCFAYQDGGSKRLILDHLSASFDEGKIYSILGVSGSGKTTFLSLISTLERIQEGEILFEGKSIQAIDESEYRSQDIALIFQNYNLIPYLNAYQNLVCAMEIAHQEASTIQEKAYELLERVGIDRKKAHQKVTHLSGGEQQRVAIARALSTNAKVILADEPTGNLDKENAKTVMELFQQLAHQDHKCVIIVTHSSQVAEDSDVVLELDRSTKQFVKRV